MSHTPAEITAVGADCCQTAVSEAVQLLRKQDRGIVVEVIPTGQDQRFQILSEFMRHHAVSISPAESR